MYTQWSITHPQGIKTWSLKVNGCNLRTSRYVKLARIKSTKDTCFLSYMENRSKNKQIHKNKYDYIQTQLQYMFLTVELLYGTWGKRERKKE
jgi:hypothetical protein